MNENNNITDLSIAPEELINLYLNGRYDDLSNKFIGILQHFEFTTYLKLTPSLKFFVNIFADTFLYLFTRSDYILQPYHASIFINLNHVISNIVAMSDYQNTDPQLKLLDSYENNMCNFQKKLILYSSRNTFKIDIPKLFATDPIYSSIWYFNYFSSFPFYSTVMNDNIIEHSNTIIQELAPVSNNILLAYLSTYYLPDNDKNIKQKINELFKRLLQNTKIQNNPDKNKIAIVTANWYKEHKIYKTFFRFIKALSDDYDLTLIHTGNSSVPPDTAIFKDVKYIVRQDNKLVLELLQNNDFILAYYPDLGTNNQSITLSNLRIAPVQAAGYGHPVSTYGSAIDYFIGSGDVEIKENAEQNYSEKLLLTEGLGFCPIYPDYKIKNNSQNQQAVIINCPWRADKINYRILDLLKQILNLSDKNILFRFFPGWQLQRSNKFIPFENYITSLLGADHAEIVPDKSYEEYMEVMEEGIISINAFFCGVNSTIESLYLGKPVVTMEGNQACTRMAGAVLRRLGLAELVSSSDNEYVQKVLNLINNEEYRFNLCDKIKKIDLRLHLNLDESANFKKVIDFLIENYFDIH